MESPELKVKEQLVSAVTRWHWASVSHPRAVTAHLSLFICLPHSHSVTMNPGLPQCLQSFPGLSLSHSLSYFRASLVAQLVKKKKKKNLSAMQETLVQFLGWEDSLEEGMATHSSIPALRISWTEEPGGLQSMGSQRLFTSSLDIALIGWLLAWTLLWLPNLRPVLCPDWWNPSPHFALIGWVLACTLLWLTTS